MKSPKFSGLQKKRSSRRLFLRRIVGHSMGPGLAPGDLVIATHRAVRVGDIVIASPLKNREIIKRVEKVTDKGLYLLGDNPAKSTDSRDFGYVDMSAILGVVIMKLHLAKATSPPQPISRRLLAVPFLLAFITLIMLLSQLYTSEDFVVLFLGYGLGETMSKLVASALIIAELFAMPFWLGMKLSPPARTLSAGLGLMFPLYWLLFSVAPMKPANIGYFGSVVAVEEPVIKVAVALGLVALSVASFYILRGKTLFARV